MTGEGLIGECECCHDDAVPIRLLKLQNGYFYCPKCQTPNEDEHENQEPKLLQDAARPA